ncbi:MAG TPA: 2-oxo acid dehydrogenase subunit E2 [Gemmataceae bacterium]|jgi:pyruvate dehydrogenase E2 component (dihydrolipoamide acetyltransferase)
MAAEIKLPELAENFKKGQVVEVKIAPGDTVQKDQTLLVIDAEKATLDAVAPMAGKITQVLVKVGDEIKLNQAYCYIEPVGAAANGETAPTSKPAATPKKETATAPRAQPVVEAPARPKPAPAVSNTPRSEPAAIPVDIHLLPAGPATRRIAREWQVDLQRVPGTGRGGRVTQEDVKTYLRSLATGAAVVGGIPQAPPLPDFEKFGPIERQPLTNIRRKTAEHMALAWNQIPHVTQHDDADITDLDAFRRQQKGPGPKLTMTVFALKAAAIALRQFPQFNSSLDLANGHLILKRFYNIGVAVDTERGLLVPVLRDVDKKSVNQLAQELLEAAEKARQGKVDMTGGTFTITNLGGIGGTAFTPIVNYPEVAILGMSRARLQPVIRDGSVTPRLLLPISLSYDHRVIDGADAARFTRRIAELLEQPLTMLLHA